MRVSVTLAVSVVVIIIMQASWGDGEWCCGKLSAYHATACVNSFGGLTL
jgi:hypothetical protein